MSGPHSKWNALNGSIGVFVGMALVPEYLSMLVLIHVGFAIPRVVAHAEKTDTSKLTLG